uniref:Uncharacterized protein n=1 Tax=Castor canadensis TaxID=51338 RepID=A0A8C0W628_CASCN
VPPYTIIYFPSQAPQVPEWRPHSVPVQCNPAAPGPFPQALWQRPVRGSTTGHGE